MKLDFLAIDKESSEAVSEQIARAFRGGILCGDLAFGEAVPSIRSLAERLSVGVKTVRTAYEVLKADGWLRSTAHRGFVAATPDMPQWKGDVLVVSKADYSNTMLVAGIESRLSSAGWLVMNIIIDRLGNPRAEYGPLDAMLTRPFDLVIVLSDSGGVLERIRYAGKPYICLSHALPRFGGGCRGVVRLRHKKNIETIACEAGRLGVRSIWCVDYQVTHRYVAEIFRRKGFDVSFQSTGCDSSARSLSDAVQESAYRKFADLASKAKPKWPDLVFFLDDYVALGALSAMVEKGVKMPDDVRVIACTNVGHALPFGNRFARIEFDLVRAGGEIGGFALERLHDRRNRVVCELELGEYVGSPASSCAVLCPHG
jgi:DNA-binding LacI/PurR family transcriptional regulator